MNLEFFALLALGCAALPCALFVTNLFAYRRLPRASSRINTGISVLIPARDEQENIQAALTAALANERVPFEVIVLDDHSSDRTAEIVAAFARRDPRVRLESAPPLPDSWCGKAHACQHLARLARHPLVLFVDADVRLGPQALARMVAFMGTREIALASGVPRQEVGTLSERLLIPLIHFVLLGFLPMHAMRRTRLPEMSGGCGQLLLARRDAYEACGGHASAPGSLHDGIQLPRVFRRAGFATDLFDATDVATCRMYRTQADTWRGLARNADEGLGARGVIIPMTVLLLAGQVLPFILLLLSGRPSHPLAALCWSAIGMAYVPRLLAVFIFRQPVEGALLHPVGVLALLAIQWHTFLQRSAGVAADWKGRRYDSIVRPLRRGPA